MRLPESVKISEKVPSEKKQGVSSDNTSILSDHYLVSDLALAGCSSRTKQQRNTKLSTQSAMGL